MNDDAQKNDRRPVDREQVERRRAFIINAAYIGVVAVLVLLAIRYLIPWLLPFLIGYGIAMFFKPVVRFLTGHTPLGEKFTGCVVLLLAYALIALLLVLGGVRFIGWLSSVFSGLVPFYNETLQPAILDIVDWFDQLLGTLSPDLSAMGRDMLDAFLGGLQNFLVTLSASALSALGSLTTRVPGFILAFFFTIMSSLIISMNYGEIAGFLARQVPERHRSLLFDIKASALRSLGLYLIAYLKLMAVTCVELSVGFLVLGVDNAVPVAAGIALFDLLPVLGTGGIMIPWTLYTFITGNLPLGLGLLILYAIVTVVRQIIEPRIVGNQLGLHPLVTLCAMYIGFKTMGLLGMIFFPILAQLLVGLHQTDVIRLWK